MKNSAALKYRPEIDGLRAVAVVAVVGFHAFPTLLPGGYVGVDIFFVISGFLITSIIVDGLNQGRFSFADFYIRRTRRIFPALALVLAVCLAAGWAALLPSEFIMLAKHAAAATAFVINFVLLREVGYFAVSAELKPLLHLWSLSIEEQFYLVWPLVAFLAFRFRQGIFYIALAIVSLSFAINLIITARNPNTAFFFPLSRSWELLLGGCLATLPARFSVNSSTARNFAAFIGATLIGLAVAFFDRASVFPGWRALLPTLGAVLIIWSGSGAWLNRHILSKPLPVGIGLISYPLYLWHWPLLSFLAINNDHAITSRVIAVMSSVALAWATYQFLEKPIRHANRTVWRWLAVTMGAVGAVAIAAYVPVFSTRWSSPELAAIDNAQSDFRYPTGTPINFLGEKFYREGSGPDAILFIGDSNMQQYYPRIHAFVADNKATAIYATYGGCIPIPELTSTVTQCPGFMKSAFAFARSDDVKTVVIASQWQGYFASSSFKINGEPLESTAGRAHSLKILQGELSALRKAGKRVFLVLNIPIGKEFSPAMRLRRTLTSIEVLPASPVSREIFPPGYEQFTADLRRAGEASGAIVIDPYDFLCDRTACKTTDQSGEPIYKDGTHLRASFVRDQVDFLDQIFRADASN